MKKIYCINPLLGGVGDMQQFINSMFLVPCSHFPKKLLFKISPSNLLIVRPSH